MSAYFLNVEHFGRPVGRIRRTEDGGLAFEYSEAWLQAPEAFPIAQSLPLAKTATPTDYFRNLLPEAGTRKRIAKAAGISEDNDFEFLRLFGEDCAGALTVLAPGRSKLTDGPTLFDLPLDGKLLATRSGFASLFTGDEKPRLSLAGAQDKLAVVKTEGGLAVPMDGRPSTHVLKLPNRDFGGLVHNEALMLSTARALGLPVVNHEVFDLGGTTALLLERFDRTQHNGKVGRLHQQDICQAVGLPPETKYEMEGGPTLVDCFNTVCDAVVDPLPTAQWLVEWTVFNVLVHNADAHAKNLSILRLGDGTQRLAPFYDLVCTGTYADLDHKLAMSVGGQRDPGGIAYGNWVKLAQDLGMGRDIVLDTVEKMVGSTLGAFDVAADQLAKRFGRVSRRQQLRRVIERRIKKTTRLLKKPR